MILGLVATFPGEQPPNQVVSPSPVIPLTIRAVPAVAKGSSGLEKTKSIG